MKKRFGTKIMSFLLTAALLVGCTIPSAFAAETETPQKEYMQLAYMYYTDADDVDYSVITHLNYSFGLIYNKEYETEEGFRKEEWNDVDEHPEKLNTIYLEDWDKENLRRVNELKAEQNPDLKVLLSVGGWGARGFSDVAATEEGRATFANSCKQFVDEFQLDGIDLDWEYPVIGGWGEVKARPEDKQNFTLLLQAVRDAIGSDKLLTIAGSANVKFTTEWTEFQKVVEILDFINCMTYDFHHETCYYGYGLYASTMWPTRDAVSEYNADMAIHRYIVKGCPPEKINLGYTLGYTTLPSALRDEAAQWPFVSAGIRASGFTSEWWTDNATLVDKYLNNKTYTFDLNGESRTIRFEKKWDDEACLHIVVAFDEQNNELFVLSYLDNDALDSRADYIKTWDLRGSFFWEYGSDPDSMLATHMARPENLDTKYEMDPAVAEVAKLINALPDEITLEDEAAILAARKAYNALNDKQKALIIRLDKLIAAEEALAALKPSRLKDTLERLIKDAEALQAAGKVEDCIPSVQQVFQTALDEARAVLADPLASRDAIQNASLKLLKAIGLLNYVQGDKAKLEMAVELAESMDLTLYEDSGKAAFNQALKNAKAVLEDEEALQAEIDSTWDALTNAMLALRFKVDTATLEALLKELQALDLSAYTDDSALALRAAMGSAALVLAEPDSQETVDNVVRQLQAAKDALVEKPVVAPDDKPGNDPERPSSSTGTPGHTGTVNPPKHSDGGSQNASNPKTADNTPYLLLMILPLLSGCAWFYLRKQKS